MALERDFPPDLRVENEIKSLIKAGHQVSMACYTFKGQTQVFDWNGCTIYKKKISRFIHKSSIGALRFPFYFKFWRKHLQSIINKEGNDAIHIHDLPLAKIGYEFKNKLKAKFVLDLHENWPAYLRISTHTQGFWGRLLSSNKQWEAYEKKYVNKADKVIVVVDEARERLNKLCEKTDNRIVVSNTINIEETTPLISKTDENYITLFYGGGINYHRGLQCVIEAMPTITASNNQVRLWIVGDGSYKSKLEELSQRLNMTSNITFFGFKPYKEMLALLAKSDIALIPHLVSDHTNSTIPHKLFQYMYYEKPIVASECLPLKRIIEQTQTGITYNPDNIEHLAQLIVQIVKNHEQNLALGKNGKKWVQEHYNWDFDSQTLTSLYDFLHKS